MNLRIDGKLITSLSNDELGATLQQIADEIKRRKLSFDLADNVMGCGKALRGYPEQGLTT
jgi:hypothetical protein